MASYKSEFGSQIPLKFNINYQQIEESRHNRQVQATNRQSRIEKVKILGFDLYHQRSIKTNQLLIGLDGQFEMLSSSAKATHIFSKIESPLDTRYPAGSNEMIRVGAYAILNNQINKAINTQSSIRFGYTGLSSDFGNTDFFKLPYKTVAQSNFTYSGNLGLNYALSESSRWGLVLASGYRAPNVDDLAKVFESTSGILIVPNPDLRPEKSLSFELNYRKLFENSNSNFSASAYITQLYNAIVTGPFKFNGKDSVFYDGKTSIVLANQNNRLARIFGVSLSGFISMNRSVSIRYGGTYTNGRILNQSKNTPLDHIPPISGKLGIEFKPSKKLNFDVDVIANAWKRLEDYLLLAEDNERYATEQGMPAWVIGNLHSTYRFTPNFRIGINLENILDTQYRVFASGINAAGRNISLSVHFKF